MCISARINNLYVYTCVLVYALITSTCTSVFYVSKNVPYVYVYVYIRISSPDVYVCICTHK